MTDNNNNNNQNQSRNGNDVVNLIEYLKNSGDDISMGRILDYISERLKGEVHVQQQQNNNNEQTPQSPLNPLLLNFEKLADIFEITWYKIPNIQNNELITKIDTLFKSFIKNILVRLQLEEFQSDNLKTLALIFSPKYLRSEYRYHHDSDDIQSKIALHEAIVFFNDHGVDILINRIKNYRCSFETIKKIIGVIKKIAKNLDRSDDTSISPKIIQNLIEIVYAKILGSTDEEFKNESKKDLEQIHKYLLEISHEHEQLVEHISQNNLEVSLKCFKSPSLEKRNAGLNDIIRYIRYDAAGHMGGYRGSSLGGIGSGNSMSSGNYYGAASYGMNIGSSYGSGGVPPGKIVDWIKENRLVETLYGETMHIQLLQKCTDILKFLAEQKSFERKYLDLIWSASEGKHETIENEIYDTIGKIANCLTVEDTEYLFEKVAKIPYEHYTHHTLQLIQNLIPSHYQIIQYQQQQQLLQQQQQPSQQQDTNSSQDNDNNNNNNNNNNVNAQKYIPRGIEICWDLFQDDCEVNSDITEQSLVLLQDSLLKFPDLKYHYLQKCLENLKNHTSVILSLRLIYQILTHLPRKKQSPMMNNRQSDSAELTRIVEQVDQNYNLIDLIYDQIIFYYDQCTLSMEKLMVDTDEVSVNEMIIIGKHSHFNHVSDYLSFLGFIYTQCPNTLVPTIDQINILWQSYVVKGLSCQDRYIFYNFIEKLVALTDINIYKNLLLLFRTLSPKDIDIQSLNFFMQLMGQLKLLSNNQDGLYKEILDDLWRVALQTNHEDAAKYSIDYLIEQYQKNSILKPEEILNICISRLAQCQDNLSKSRCLSVIKKYLEDFGSRISDSFKRNYSPLISIILNGTKGKYRVEVRSNETIQNIKHIVALKAQIPNPQCVYLYHVNKLLTDDYESLEDNKVVHGDNISYQEHPDNPRVPDQFRSTDIHFEQAHYTTLFSLLNSQDKIIAQDAWDLLMLLPVNKKILDEIKTLSTSSDNGNAQQLNWNQLLDPTSSFKLLYTLQIIDSFVNPSLLNNGVDQDRIDQERLIWKQRFITSGGLQHLLDILMKADLQSETRGSKRKICISLILRVTLSFVVDNLQALSGGVNLVELVNRIIYLIYQQAANSETDEDSYPVHETEDAVVINQLLNFMIILMESNNQLLDVLIQHKDLNSWISLLTLESYDNFIRDKVTHGIYEICTKITPQKSQTFFLKQLLNLLFGTIEEHRNIGTCSQFFELLCMLLKTEISNKKVTDAETKDLLLKLCKMVKTQPICESSNVYLPDYAIMGFLSLIKLLIEGSPNLKYVAGVEQNLVKEIFHQCLFDIATSDNHGPFCPPKCKVKDSRDVCFSVLLELAKDCQENFKELTDLLMEHQKPEEKRSLWSYFPAGNEKSTTGYVGLRNLGATCYINSLMQQLFMITGFRFNIISAEDTYKSQQEQQESLLYQLRVIFSNLQESEKKSYDPKDFCQAYKYDGQPINTNVQMDVDEFFNMLFDKLETTLKGSPQEKLLLDFFGGSNVNQFISQECPHVSEREEPFYTISVEVKNKKEIQESLQLFVESETLDGDNKYFCSTCSQKVKALMRRCVKNLPNNLIIHNKRFEFDLDFLKRTKLNDAFRFPMTLDMSPYTKEFIERKERMEKAKAANEPIPEETPLHPPGYYQYDLAGVIVHTGTADSGHYYSYIKEREPLVEGQPRKWILFNDQATEVFNPEDIAKACFGGYDQMSLDQGKMSYRPSPRLNNAYMLFYERSYVEGELTQAHKDIHPSTASKLVPEDLFQNVWQKNMKFLNDKNIFDSNYFSFINSIVKLDPVQGPLLDFDQTMQSIELASRFLVETMFHSKDRKLLPEISNYLITLFEKHTDGCYWFLRQFIDDPQWIKQNFLVCLTMEPREALTKLLLAVIKTILPEERNYYDIPEEIEEDDEDDEDDEDESFEDIEETTTNNNNTSNDAEMISIDGEPKQKQGQKQKAKSQMVDNYDNYFFSDFVRSKSVIIQFMDHFLEYIKDAHQYWKHFSNYWNFIKEFALIGHPERSYLVGRSVIGRLIDFYLGDESPVKFPPTKKTRMGDKFNSPILDKMLEAIAILVCSCRSDADIKNDTRKELLTMPEEDMKLLYNPIFLGKAIREGLAPGAVNDMIAHICLNDREISTQFISSVLTLDPCRSGLDVFTTLIKINDEYKLDRMDIIMKDYVPYLDHLLKNRQNITYFAALLEHASTNSVTSSWFGNNTQIWLYKWLVESDYYEIRSEAFSLIHELSGLKKYSLDPTHPDNAANASKLLILFTDLLQYLRVSKKYLKRELRTQKFENFFNLLRLLLCVPGTKEIFASDFASDFYRTTIDIMTLTVEIDRNRQELMHFIADLIKNSTINLEILYKEPFSQKLMDYFISVSSKDELKQFNQKSLPYFYEVLYHISAYNSEFLDYIAPNNNFEWASKYLVCECNDYPQVAHYLLRIMELIASKRPKYIPKLLHSLIHFDNVFFYPPHSLELFNILTPTKKEIHSFVNANGLANISKFLNTNKEQTNETRENVLKTLELVDKILYKKEQVVGEHSEIGGANYDPQEIYKHSDFKLLIAALFNQLDSNEKVAEKAKKMLNFIILEAPDITAAAVIDISSKKKPLPPNNNISDQSFQHLNNNNMLQTLQQQNSIINSQSPHEHHNLMLLEILDQCSNSPNLSDISKVSIAYCKVIKDLVYCNLELAKSTLTRVLEYLKKEEKQSLVIFSLNGQNQIILNDPEFYEIIRSLLKEIDEEFILTICNSLDEKISTDIASIQSLGQINFQNQDIDKHFHNLTLAIKHIELLENLKESSDQSLKLTMESLKQFATNDCNIYLSDKARQFLNQFANRNAPKK